MGARLARTNAQVSVERALVEPGRWPGDPDLPLAVLTTCDRIAQSGLSMLASLRDAPGKASPAVELFAERLSMALDRVSEALSRARRPPPVDLRVEQRRLRASAEGPEANSSMRVIAADGERLVRTLDALSGRSDREDAAAIDGAP